MLVKLKSLIVKLLLGREAKIEKIEIDTLDLIRNHLGGVSLDFIGEKQLTEKELEELCANAEIMRSNPAFEYILNELINAQGNFTVKNAQTLEQVNFGRATINGLQLFKEEIEKLSNQYREKHTTEDIDKFSILGD